MNEFLKYIRQNGILIAVYILLFILFYNAYSEIVGEYVTLVIVVLFFSYTVCMAISHRAMSEILKHERTFTLTFEIVAKQSFQIGLPIYWLWFLFSLIPIPDYEIWLITGLPVTVLGAMPLESVADYWRGKWKVIFWAANILIYLILLITGQVLIGLVLDKLYLL